MNCSGSAVDFTGNHESRVNLSNSSFGTHSSIKQHSSPITELSETWDHF